MSRLARTADRIATGSNLLARRLASRCADFIRKGRRDDLTGWRATLGCWARLALLGLAGYALCRLVRAVPNVMWLLSAAWTAAAWHAGRPSAETLEETAGEDAPAPGVEDVRRLLLDVMGDASAVHLRTVLAHLQDHGQWQGRTVTDLRVHLARLQVPHDSRVKVAGVPTWGVRRRDLEPSSPAEPQEASTAPSTAA